MWPQTGPRTTPRRPRQAPAITRQRWSWAPWVAGSVVVIVMAAVVAIVGSQPSGPSIGDHWHAPFKIVVCGERVPPLPQSVGDIHTHGDDIIHIHPDSSATAGRNATIAAFLNSVALQVTETSITIGSKTVKNGDRCADGRAGTVSVLINGVPTPNFPAVVPKDGEQIEIRFEP
jgi:hypothetical protein